MNSLDFGFLGGAKFGEEKKGAHNRSNRAGGK